MVHAGGWGWLGVRADSTHWPSCKSLFYGPCNDPPASNLHSVALQIEPAASGSRCGGAQYGWRRQWETGKHTHCATTNSPTHTFAPEQTHPAMFPFIKMHAFSHPIYLNPNFLCKGHRKRRRLVFFSSLQVGQA